MASTSYKGWHSKALQTQSSSSSFIPSSSSLSFVALSNTQVDPEGFTLALFHPSTAVDALGRVLSIPPDLLTHMDKLAKDVNALPDTGSFMNTWRVQHEVTCHGIDRLFVKQGEGGELRETSVYGFSETRAGLQDAVGEYTELPQVLRELMALVVEAKGDGSGEKDAGVIERVKKEIGVQ